MIRIVADNKIPFLKGVLDSVAEVSYLPGREIGREHVSNADALILRTRTKCNRELLEGTQVKYIATATIGYDHLDTGFLDANGIKWSNAPGCNSGSVRQYMASALASIVEGHGMSFKKLTIGIIGVGHVGKKVESLARALGMDVLLNDPPRERKEGKGRFVSIGELLANSDIVTLHVPLNIDGPDKSYHMANEYFLGRMKRGAWLINTSRGEVVETSSLIRNLRDESISGAVLDVWENEPEIDRELLRLSKISTPHIAGYSLDGKADGTSQSVRSVSRFFKLGLDDWYPVNVPAPSDNLIRIKRDSGSPEQVMKYVFSRIYDINADSDSLKSAPADFEKFRDNYPPRREFGAYTISFEDSSDSYSEVFQKLGFSIQ